MTQLDLPHVDPDSVSCCTHTSGFTHTTVNDVTATDILKQHRAIHTCSSIYPVHQHLSSCRATHHGHAWWSWTQCQQGRTVARIERHSQALEAQQCHRWTATVVSLTWWGPDKVYCSVRGVHAAAQTSSLQVTVHLRAQCPWPTVVVAFPAPSARRAQHAADADCCTSCTAFALLWDAAAAAAINCWRGS